jgi:DNA-binding transcriptional ArsR family regulator
LPDPAEQPVSCVHECNAVARLARERHGAAPAAPQVLDMQVNACILSTVESDAVFKALADRTRRRLLDLLHEENGQTLGALCEHMDMTRQGVTQHLAILEAANLVAVVWHGREKLHYLNPVPLFEVYERWIEKFERGRLRALRDLKKTLEADKNE